MFGRQPQTQSKQPSKEFDLDELLSSTLKDVDEDLDMNDPDLLKQLQELSSPPSKAVKSKPAAKKKAKIDQNMEIDLDSYAALAKGDDDDVHVDLDETDFSDPHLLNELSSLSKGPEEPLSHEVTELMNMGFTQKQATRALEQFDNNLERAANYLFDSPPMDETEEEEPMPTSAKQSTQARLPTPVQYHTAQDEEEEEGEEESIDPQVWKEKAYEYQKLALAAKKSGDKKKAITLLRESKAHDQKYQELSALYGDVAMDTKDEPVVAEPIKPVESIKIATPTSPQPADSPSVPEKTMLSPQQIQKTQALLENVITLQKQYKEAALHYKGLGNLNAAKQMVRTSKNLLHTGISLKNGEVSNIDMIKLPDAPDMTLGDGKIRQVEPLGNITNSYGQIEAQLAYQMNVCHNISIQNGAHMKKNATGKTLSNSLDPFAAAESAFSFDLVSLKAEGSQQPLPSLHYEQVNYTYKNILDTIPDNMMELKIIRAISLPTLDIATKLEPFTTWDFGGWPPETSAQAAMNKGETPIASGVNPEYDFSIMIPISRTNRLFTRYVQRKKLTIEVLHNKYTYGLFRRPTSLGKVVIPMDRLLTKASISGVFDLLDANRKKTGGKIEIQVNLREPMTGEDIVKKSERWLVLDSFGSTASQCLSTAGLTVGGPFIPQAPSTPQTSSTPVASTPMADDSPKPHNIENTTASMEPVEDTKEPEQLPPSAPKESESKSIDAKLNNITVVGESSELEQAELEFNSVDNIISNMVMEHEMGLVNAGLANKSNKNKEDLMDRKQDIEIKMNMLVIQVQTGMLDMNTYLDNVQKRMDADRRLALIFKKHGRLDLAKAALTRKKIMQDELEEARAAMEDQAEE